MTWAFSIATVKESREDWCITRETHHSCGVVEAVSKHEAIGKALEIAKKLYPHREGWSDHDAVVHPTTDIITAENAHIVD
jgi:hypothetical protein